MDADQITADIKIQVEGNTVNYFYRGKKYLSHDVYVIAVQYKDMKALRGEVKSKQEEVEESKVPTTEVVKFAQAYCSMIKKYSGQTRKYSKGNAKVWPDMIKGCAKAREAEMGYLEYVELFFNYYNRMNTDDKASHVWPRQLHGPVAENILLSHISSVKGIVSIETKMRKLARSRKYVSLSKDDYFIECRERLKSKSFTKGDIEYIKLRQIQTYGEPKAWLLKYEEDLDGK